MKKLIAVLFVLAVAGGMVFAEDLMFGNGYIIDESGDAYSVWDLEVDIPVIDLIELDEEDEEWATLYYSYGYDSYIEPVYMEYADEYSSVMQMTFYSDYIGPVVVHISEDAEVNADELYAMLASYTVETELGPLTYVGIVAAEHYQYEDDEISDFNDYVTDIKSEYEYEVYGGK